MMSNQRIMEQDNEYRDSICKNHIGMHLECVSDRPKLSLTFLVIATMHHTTSRVFKAHVECDNQMTKIANKKGEIYKIPDFKHHNLIHEMIMNYWITSNAILGCRKMMKKETLQSILNGAFYLLDDHHQNCFTVASECNNHRLAYNEIMDAVNSLGEEASFEFGSYWANLLFEDEDCHPFFPTFLNLAIVEAIRIQSDFFEKALLNASSSRSRLLYKYFNAKLF